MMSTEKRFTDVFIDRPIATILITFAIVLVGLLGYVLLPVSPLPDMEIPTIRVSANMPGASAETMASTVATPLERSLGRIAGVTEMTSSSAVGTTSVILQFDMSRDINGAARDVQAALNAARGQLPSGLRSNPSYRKFNPADAPIMIMAMTSEVLTRGQMYDVASTFLAQRLLQVEGVGDVTIGGSALPAVRVQLNPFALANQGISLTDVGQTIATANQLIPLGAIEGTEQSWQIKTSEQLSTAKEVMPLIINHKSGAAVRLSDVADVTDSVENNRNIGLANGKPAIILIIRKSADANIIDAVDGVKAAIPELQKAMSGDINLQVTMDRSVTIRASLSEVERALTIAVVLVIMVVFMFLGRPRMTLIPAVAVPVSLIGTFAVMYLLGYSLNNLSLMALTISTGFVVDDAIVVLENIMRYIEEGMPPKEAASKGVKEVGFTVLSMSLSLIAVFTPFIFIGDLLGRLFREFAVTLSVAILISLVVSLVTTPMMCAYLLKTEETNQPSKFKFVLVFQDFLNRLQKHYAHALGFALKHRRLTILSWFATIFLTGYFFVLLPKGFFPEQDTGSLSANIRADQSVSFQAMSDKVSEFMNVILADPAVDKVMGSVGSSGFGNSNSARTFITLKPLKERGESMKSVIARLRKKTQNVAGAQIFFSPVQDLPSGGRSASADNQFTLQSDDLTALRDWEPKLREAMKKIPGFVDVDSDQESKGLESQLIYNRDAMSRHGVTVVDLNRTLYNAFGQSAVSTIYADKNQYRIIIEVAPQFAQSPEALDLLTIINKDGAAIPLSAFATWSLANSPLTVNHQGQFASNTISFNLEAGYAFSYAQDQMEQLVVKLGLPTSIQAGFAGSSQNFQKGQSQQLIVLVMALASVYLVLGMLYESYIHPITILSTIPSAGMGALMALWMFNREFTVIAMIAMLLLIGIVKKNAIMLIDFAIAARRQEGLSAQEAIIQACYLRFRPILMTTFAAMLGALPLAIASGDGAELRQPLGIAIVGGLVVSQLLTLFTTPVMYLYLDRFGAWVRRWSSRRPSVQTSEAM